MMIASSFAVCNRAQTFVKAATISLDCSIHFNPFHSTTVFLCFADYLGGNYAVDRIAYVLTSQNLLVCVSGLDGNGEDFC